MTSAGRGLRIVALAVALLASAGATAADPCGPFRYVQSDPPPVFESESFLLAVEREGLPPSFLLGTFHSADPRVRARWEPVVLLPATGRIRLMVTERTDDPPLSDADDPRLLPAGESLRMRMDPLGLGERLEAVASRSRVQGGLFDRLRPWLAAALVEQGPVREFPENDEVLDTVLLRQARALGVPVRALESLDSLAAAYDQALAPDEQSALLAAALCNTEATAHAIEGQTDAYADNHPGDFYGAMNRLGFPDPAVEARLDASLVRARNRRFWEQTAPEFARGGVLVAVGNLHVLGEGGLAPRLAAAGFRVSPIDPGRLPVSLSADQVPRLAGWVRDWVAREGGSSAVDFTGLRIEPASVVSLRQRRCPGQRCRIEGTYLADEGRILLETGLFARLLAGGAAPLPEYRAGSLVLSAHRAPPSRDDRTAYAESILVRELVRHALHPTGARRDGTAPNGAESPCRDGGILHRASLAQAAYLSDRGARSRAHIFPAMPCPEEPAAETAKPAGPD